MNTASLAIALAVVLATPAVLGQAQPNSTPPSHPCANTSTENVHAFTLKNAPQGSDANEMYTALRNMLPPDDKSYLVVSQNTIFLCGTPEQIALAQKMLNELDKPKKLYRLIYTVTEFDGNRTVNTQHYSMVAAPGQKTTLKQGSRTPIITGSYDYAKSGQQTQVTYLDVGMNFDVTVLELANGVQLNTSVEQSSIAEEKSGVGPQDPVIRQTSLKGSSYVTPGKPLMLGSVDLAGSTHRLDIQVTMEPLP